MPKIPPCSRDELVRKLRKLGFAGPFTGGKHSYMKRGGYRQIIPNPHGKDVSSDLVKEILKQANISVNEWLPNRILPQSAQLDTLHRCA